MCSTTISLRWTWAPFHAAGLDAYLYWSPSWCARKSDISIPRLVAPEIATELYSYSTRVEHEEVRTSGFSNDCDDRFSWWLDPTLAKSRLLGWAEWSLDAWPLWLEEFLWLGRSEADTEAPWWCLWVALDGFGSVGSFLVWDVLWWSLCLLWPWLLFWSVKHCYNGRGERTSVNSPLISEFWVTFLSLNQLKMCVYIYISNGRISSIRWIDHRPWTTGKLKIPP